MNGQALENPFSLPFRISIMILVALMAAALLSVISPLLLLAVLGGIALLCIPIRWPIATLGVVLAFMPVDFMAIGLGKLFELPHMTLVSVCTKEIPLFLLLVILYRRSGFKPTAPDWWLLAAFGVATLRTLVDGTFFALWTDFNFILPYFLGRVTILTQAQEQLWARCAVWIAAVLSMLGLFEVFLFGEGPRTVLYTALDTLGTENGVLTASFHGSGFKGLREAATMVGPNSFGVLCMVALILWWVYCRNPLPAAMVVTGLICTVTRADWLATAAALLVLAVITSQRKRLILYATLALVLFVCSIPILGLSDYLFYTKTGQDLSAEYHQQGIVDGLLYAAEHPLGAGNEKLSPLALLKDRNALIFETTYPYFAAEYGIPAALCFVGFLLSGFRSVWRKQDRLAYAAVGILIGISVVMIFTLPLNDRRLACWVFFPVGLAIRARSGGEING
jgi:hypothetical protein